MTRKLFPLFILFLISFVQETKSQIDSLLNLLDRTVEKRSLYTAQRKALIDSISGRVSANTSQDEVFSAYNRMFDEYKNFQLDSALHVAERRKRLAVETRNEAELILSEMNLIEVMVVTGMYKEAMDMLETIRFDSSDDRLKAYSNHLYHSLYVLLADYSFTGKEKAFYKEKSIQYKDSILLQLAPGDFGYRAVYTSKLVEEGKCREAVVAGESLFAEYSEQPHDMGLTAYLLSAAYHCSGEKELEKKYLTISAIGDLRAGVKEYIALRKLAILLYEEGDVKRAYTYTKSAMEDALFCHARLRTLETSQMLPIINSAYDEKMKQEKQNLYFFLLVVSLLMCVLVAALIYINRQMRNLAKHRRLLKDANEELKRTNEEMDKANTELKESNLVKEEYISSLFHICSTYIGKLDEFRITVNRKLKVKQYDDLIKFTDSSSLVGDELKEFYKNFDAIFLNLYPNFISDFNALLQDDAHIYPKEGELLSPELRIYALVRLGISDSVKIAGFLHYSPQTVYNYRLRTRNKARISKEDFPAAVKSLGKIQD